VLNKGLSVSDTPKRWEALGWSFATGDVSWEDYGGTWQKHLQDGRYVFVVFTNMEDACGADHDPQFKYEAAIKMVDLEELDAQQVMDACSGLDMADICEPLDEEQRRAVKALFVMEYGIHAQLDCLTDPSYPIRLRGRAFARAEEIVKDGELVDSILGSTCNKIGTTWLENMQGDLLAPLHRRASEILTGEAKPGDEPTKDLMIKMYKGGMTLGGPAPLDLTIAGELVAAADRELEDGGK